MYDMQQKSGKPLENATTNAPAHQWRMFQLPNGCGPSQKAVPVEKKLGTGDD